MPKVVVDHFFKRKCKGKDLLLPILILHLGTFKKKKNQSAQRIRMTGDYFLYDLLWILREL